MSATSDMLSVVMDGIKDTDMILDYADESDHPAYEEWFEDIAKRRYSMLVDEFNFVCDAIGLKERVSAGDEIAKALHEHLLGQIERLKKRM